MNNHSQIFNEIYKKNTWGTGPVGCSGYGSSLHSISSLYIPFLRNFISSNNIKTVCDLGCGEFSGGTQIYDSIRPLEYIGYDIYEPLIIHLQTKYKNLYSFSLLDIFNNKNNIPDADLYILKDVLQHWSNVEIESFLSYIVKSKTFKYILISNSSDDEKYLDTDIKTGDFRPLSVKHKSLKKYSPISLLQWGNSEEFLEQSNNIWIKNIFEVSLITKQ